MPSASHSSSKSSGHGPYPPQSVDSSAASTVYVNNKLAGSVGDSFTNHNKGGSSPNSHDGSISSGSSTVFIQGSPAGRVGDNVGCGGAVVSGSGNVFIGG